MSQISSMELKARYLGQGMINPLQRYKRIEIEHVPIAVTKSNKLLCIPKTEEVKHIGITGMCYDKETEVLTDKGWKFFKDLDKTELIAQVDPHTFAIDFIKPLSYTKEIFKGKMMLFKSRFLNLLVTPNHNMFIAINNNKIGENHFCRADDVPKFNSVKFYCIKKIKQLKKNLILSTISKKNIDTLDYNDYVYCVEVPTHLLIVKRHGKIVLCGNTGCQPYGSKVLMADGSWKNIENIKKGDVVISPQKDGSNIFSKVKSTTKWFSNENYAIEEQNRNKKSLYKCSHNHIIPFYYRAVPKINGKASSKNAIWKIRHEKASDFFKHGKGVNSHVKIGFSSFLIKKFKYRNNCKIEPYTLGVFLGDGCSYSKESYVKNKKYPNKDKRAKEFKKRKTQYLTITSMNKEIIEEVSKFYPIMSIEIRKRRPAKSYRFSVNGELHKQIEKYGLKGKNSGNKFIPKEALLSDSEYRKKLLAGIIDTDGHLSRGNSYNITTKSEQLSKDIEFLIYSLGGRCYIHKFKSRIKSINFVGEYYQICFYLHKLEIPIKLKHKIRDKKTFYLSSNRLAISVKKSDSSIVYGFEIDSPSKWYITDNWMVTHNTCKSVTLNSLLSWHYWFLKRACIILNDIQKETFEWSQPSESFNFLNKKINLNPCGTPIIYTFPSTKTLQLDQRDKHYPFIKMTLPIKEVIRNIEDYYSLDKSKVYLSNLNEELEECKSMSEIKDVLNEKIPKDHAMMKYKLMNIFESLFKNRILNVAVPEAPAFLDYKDKFNNVYYNFTIQTLMRAGFVPSIQTWDLRNHDFFSAYISFIVDSIHRSQYEDVYFKRKTVTIFLDEVDKLWKGDAGELVKKQVGLIGTNGRVARIGLIWSTQNYGAVPDTIKGNTKYLIVSRKNSDKEVNEIKKDFDIPKSMEKDILNLKSDPKNGIFEVVFLTTEKYVLYDLTTGITQLSSEPQYAYIIPPHAKHKVPLLK